MSETPLCELCGEPMPPGEEMFKYHGYSGPCPKPPLPTSSTPLTGGAKAELTGCEFHRLLDYAGAWLRSQ